jgi:hypothetical protein
MDPDGDGDMPQPVIRMVSTWLLKLCLRARRRTINLAISPLTTFDVLGRPLIGVYIEPYRRLLDHPNHRFGLCDVQSFESANSADEVLEARDGVSCHLEPLEDISGEHQSSYVPHTPWIPYVSAT